MSTIKTTNLQHPSAASPNLVLAADGSVSGGAGLGGLVLVSPTSIANSGGSASASGGAVFFTGVSSVSLNGVFTSAYQNYFCLIQYASTATSDFRCRLTTSGAANTTSNYTFQGITSFDTSVVAGRGTSQSHFYLGGQSTALCTVSANIFAPATTNPTGITAQSLRNIDSPQNHFITGGFIASTNFDGLQIYGETGNITGIIRVYGYKNS